jgi:hypothetical protein
MVDNRPADNTPKTAPVTRRQVPADLIETMPDNGGFLHWILASPMLIFLAWTWIDLFAHYSPISFYWLDVVLGLALFTIILVLPLGLGAFYLVTAAPGVFHHAGWDVQPLEPVAEAEMPMVRYQYRQRHRAKNNWGQAWTRAAQGWVYLEVAAILLGGVLMIPIFFSASEFGFGQP